MIKRFISFIQQLKNFPKKIVGNLLMTIKSDVNSTTGANIRQILNICNKNHINDLEASDADQIEYHPIPENEKWIVHMLEDIINTRMNKSEIEGFSFKELDDIVEFICAS